MFSLKNIDFNNTCLKKKLTNRGGFLLRDKKCVWFVGGFWLKRIKASFQVWSIQSERKSGWAIILVNRTFLSENNLGGKNSTFTPARSMLGLTPKCSYDFHSTLTTTNNNQKEAGMGPPARPQTPAARDGACGAGADMEWMYGQMQNTYKKTNWVLSSIWIHANPHP